MGKDFISINELEQNGFVYGQAPACPLRHGGRTEEGDKLELVPTHAGGGQFRQPSELICPESPDRWVSIRRLASLLVLLGAIGFPGFVRGQGADFCTTYTSAFFITPVNTNAMFLPNPDFQPVLSGSVEYSFRKTDRLGFELSGGFYPYSNRDEIIGRFGIRKFSAKSTAPLGAYWEMTAIGGTSQIHGAEYPDPLFGIGLELGNIRATRFGDLSFTYGGGPSIILTGGQAQVRAEFFFGLGFLLGHDIMIEP